MLSADQILQIAHTTGMCEVKARKGLNYEDKINKSSYSYTCAISKHQQSVI